MGKSIFRFELSSYWLIDKISNLYKMVPNFTYYYSQKSYRLQYNWKEIDSFYPNFFFLFFFFFFFNDRDM